jgi:hypothetical protein
MLPQFFLPQGYLTVGLTFRKLSQQHLHHRWPPLAVNLLNRLSLSYLIYFVKINEFFWL